MAAGDPVGRGVVTTVSEFEIDAERGGKFDDARLAEVHERRMDADAFASLDTRAGGQARCVFEGLDELGPAIGIAGIVDGVYPKKDVLCPQDFRPPKRATQKDRVARGHVGYRDSCLNLFHEIMFGDGYIPGERRAAEGAKIQPKGDVPLRFHCGSDTGGGFQFHAMTLAVVEGEGVAGKPFPKCHGQACSGIEPTAQQADGCGAGCSAGWSHWNFHCRQEWMPRVSPAVALRRIAFPDATIAIFAMTSMLDRLRGKKPVKTEPKEPAVPAWPGGFSDWTWTAVLFLFLTTALVQGFEIPTGSMEGTLLVGDRLLVNKQAYAPSDPVSRWLLPYRDPKRGDIIVFRFPLDLNQAYVKRVVGVPGDRIHLEDRQLFLNGKPVDEPYKSNRLGGTDPYRDNFPRYMEMSSTPLAARALEMHRKNVQDGDLVVPDGFYFAMGDNRDNSLDSRYWGLVPRDNIIGKPLVVYWSYGYPYTESFNERILDKTIRWSRMLRIVSTFPTGSDVAMGVAQ